MANRSNLAILPRSDFPTCCASNAFVYSWLESLRHPAQDFRRGARRRGHERRGAERNGRDDAVRTVNPR
jgi:hypothetical protein